MFVIWIVGSYVQPHDDDAEQKGEHHSTAHFSPCSAGLLNLNHDFFTRDSEQKWKNYWKRIVSHSNFLVAEFDKGQMTHVITKHLSKKFVKSVACPVTQTTLNYEASQSMSSHNFQLSATIAHKILIVQITLTMFIDQFPVWESSRQPNNLLSSAMFAATKFWRS